MIQEEKLRKMVCTMEQSTCANLEQMREQESTFSLLQDKLNVLQIERDSIYEKHKTLQTEYENRYYLFEIYNPLENNS